MARPRTRNVEQSSPVATVPPAEPKRKLGKYRVVGEDHLQGNVRLVLERRSDDRVFIVEEAMFQDQGGHGVPPEIVERLKR